MQHRSSGNAVADALPGGAHVVESGERKSHVATIVEDIGSWRDFLRLRPAWDALTAQDPDGALLSHDWMAQCWKCCAPLRALGPPPPEVARIVGLRMDEARGGDRWLAFLPLRYNPRTRRLCFLEEERSQRLDAVGASPSVWRAFGQYFRRLRDWDRLDLQFLRADSATSIQSIWPTLGLAVRSRGVVRQRRIRLARPWEEVNAGFSAKLRANFRRRWKRLRLLGEVTLRVHTREPRPALDACFALEAAGWKGRQGTAILQTPDLLRFYRQLAHRFAACGRLRLYCLHAGERLVAFELCIADAASRRLSSLKIAYAEDLHTASPGVVLRWLLLQRELADLDWYEFLGEDAPWKAEWTPETTLLLHLRAYNRTWRGLGWRLRSHAASLLPHRVR